MIERILESDKNQHTNTFDAPDLRAFGEVSPLPDVADLPRCLQFHS